MRRGSALDSVNYTTAICDRATKYQSGLLLNPGRISVACVIRIATARVLMQVRAVGLGRRSKNVASAKSAAFLGSVESQPVRNPSGCGL
jgi:hypothetical protein